MIAHGPYNLDLQALLRLIKNLQGQIKVTIDQLVYCPRSQKICEKLLYGHLLKYMEDKLTFPNSILKRGQG